MNRGRQFCGKYLLRILKLYYLFCNIFPRIFFVYDFLIMRSLFKIFEVVFVNFSFIFKKTRKNYVEFIEKSFWTEQIGIIYKNMKLRI